MNSFILKRPIFTEKSMRLIDSHVYTFEVDPKSTKGQIKEAVQQLFAVDVLRVQTVKVHGKTKRAGRRRLQVEQGDSKKAMVKIKANQKIEMFELKN